MEGHSGQKKEEMKYGQLRKHGASKGEGWKGSWRRRRGGDMRNIQVTPLYVETGQAEYLRPTADRSMWSGVLGLAGWLHGIRSFLILSV